MNTGLRLDEVLTQHGPKLFHYKILDRIPFFFFVILCTSVSTIQKYNIYYKGRLNWGTYYKTHMCEKRILTIDFKICSRCG